MVTVVIKPCRNELSRPWNRRNSVEHPCWKYDSNIEPAWVLAGIVQACPKSVEQHAVGINKASKTRLRSPARRHYRIAISAPQQYVPALPSMSVVDKVRTNERCMPSPFLHLKAVFERCLAVAVYKVSTILARFGCTALVGADKSVQKRMCDCGYIATVGRVKPDKTGFTLPNTIDNESPVLE